MQWLVMDENGEESLRSADVLQNHLLLQLLQPRFSCRFTLALFCLLLIIACRLPVLFEFEDERQLQRLFLFPLHLFIALRYLSFGLASPRLAWLSSESSLRNGQLWVGLYLFSLDDSVAFILVFFREAFGEDGYLLLLRMLHEKVINKTLVFLLLVQLGQTALELLLKGNFDFSSNAQRLGRRGDGCGRGPDDFVRVGEHFASERYLLLHFTG